jgi:hypothetical protein
LDRKSTLNSICSTFLRFTNAQTRMLYNLRALFRNLNVKYLLSIWSLSGLWYSIVTLLMVIIFISNRSGKPATTRGCLAGFWLGEYIIAHDLQGKNVASLSTV